jgi:hypothetical protein
MGGSLHLVRIPDGTADGAVAELYHDEYGVMTADIRIPAPQED